MSLSISLRVYAFPPGTAIPTTSSALLKTLNSLCCATALSSPNSIPKRMSGLSLPYTRIASSYSIRGNFSISTPFTSLSKCLVSPSKMFKISSCSTKAISQSICVNSGCLSARKSSSRKHFTIWKYLSIPPTISNCLKVCGDCGNA